MLVTKESDKVVEISKSLRNDMIKYTLRVPSGDNCQPFRLDIQDHFINIYHYQKIAKHEFNYKEFASTISFGAICETIDIICSHHNLRPHFDNYFMDQEEIEHWSCVTFTHEQREPITLLDEIEKRVTDRRSFKMPDELNLQKAKSILNDNFILKVIAPTDCHKVSINDSLLWTNKSALHDLLVLMNLFSKRNTGINRDNANINFADAITLFVLRAFPNFANLFSKFFLWEVVKSQNTKLMQSSPILLAYKNKCETHEDYIKIGRECLRAWCELTKLGFAVQPQSTSSFVLNNTIRIKQERNEDVSELQKRRDDLKQILGTQENIGWLFRIGIAQKEPAYSFRIKHSDYSRPLDPSSVRD